MIRLEVSERAEEDISDHFAWFAGYDLAVAERFETASRKSIELLQQHPGLGRPYPLRGDPDLRSWRVKGFWKILIFYSYDDQILVVHRVLHGYRNISEELARGSFADSANA